MTQQWPDKETGASFSGEAKVLRYATTKPLDADPQICDHLAAAKTNGRRMVERVLPA